MSFLNFNRIQTHLQFVLFCSPTIISHCHPVIINFMCLLVSPQYPGIWSNTNLDIAVKVFFFFQMSLMYFLVMIGIEPRALYMLGKSSTTEPLVLFFFETKSHNVAQFSLELTM
jgi:hypothetical protein